MSRKLIRPSITHHPLVFGRETGTMVRVKVLELTTPNGATWEPFGSISSLQFMDSVTPLRDHWRAWYLVEEPAHLLLMSEYVWRKAAGLDREQS